MRVLVALGLVSLALLTAMRLPAWRDDRALMAAAVETSPEVPRAAVNYALALVKSGDPQGAAIWLNRAGELAERRQGPRDQDVLIVVKRGLLWLEAFGTPACSQYPRYC